MQVRAEGVDSTGIADFKDQLSNKRARTKDSEGKRAASLGSGVSEDHSRSSINLFMTSRRWQRELQAASGFGADDPVNSASGVIARKLSNELSDLARTCCICSTGAGTAMQSIHVAARTIATRNRRCENQSSCPSSLLRTRGHRTARLW